MDLVFFFYNQFLFSIIFSFLYSYILIAVDLNSIEWISGSTCQAQKFLVVDMFVKTHLLMYLLQFLSKKKTYSRNGRFINLFSTTQLLWRQVSATNKNIVVSRFVNWYRFVTLCKKKLLKKTNLLLDKLKVSLRSKQPNPIELWLSVRITK